MIKIIVWLLLLRLIFDTEITAIHKNDIVSRFCQLETARYAQLLDYNYASAASNGAQTIPSFFSTYNVLEIFFLLLDRITLYFSLSRLSLQLLIYISSATRLKLFVKFIQLDVFELCNFLELSYLFFPHACMYLWFNHIETKYTVLFIFLYISDVKYWNNLRTFIIISKIDYDIDNDFRTWITHRPFKISHGWTSEISRS